MKKILFIIGIFYSVNSFAITEDTKMIVELIKSNQKINEAKFQEMNKRFDLLEKFTNAKIDALEKSMNIKIDATNSKIDALEKSTNSKIDAL